ncbi:MAG: DUF402 domain-containing protein [Chloroflexi bacterium]|nr:DUF402 domain-containing protein [Chloroflexota bacterium]
MLIHKLAHDGRLLLTYPVAQVLAQDERHICVEAFFQRPDYDLGYAVFAHGDRFVEYFYADRWYNIFAVYGSAFKGWYCNICRPATWDEARLDCADLALDVWVWPDGRTLILDEDEFAALPLTPAEREKATAALAELCQYAAENKLPT